MTTTLDKFEDEKAFKASFDNFSTTYPNDYEYIDFFYEQSLYGKIDSNGDSLCLRESNIRQLQGGLKDVYAVNFVADAFKDLRKHFAKAAYYGKIPTNLPTHFVTLRPKKGWQSLPNLYLDHMAEIYQNFVGSYLKKRGRSKRITNFTKFMEVFMQYVEQLAPDIPFTRTAFVKSSRCPPHVSGLVVEIAGFDHDEYAKHRSTIYDDPNYAFFRNAARKFGFYIDKNAPWTLVANLNSRHKYKVKPFPSQANFPDREEESGLYQYINKYVNSGMTAHEQLYYKTHLGDEWNDLSGGDIFLFRRFMFQFYNSFIASSPYVLFSQNQCAKIRGHGPSMSIYSRTLDHPTLKFFREEIGEIDINGGMPDSFIERYGPNFWLLIYMRARFAEIGVKPNIEKEFFHIAKIIRKKTFIHALEHINKRVAGHEKTKFNVLGGKRWLDRSMEVGEDPAKRFRIQMPTGKVIETGTPVETIAPSASEDTVAVEISTLPDIGSTSGAGSY